MKVFYYILILFLCTFEVSAQNQAYFEYVSNPYISHHPHQILSVDSGYIVFSNKYLERYGDNLKRITYITVFDEELNFISAWNDSLYSIESVFKYQDSDYFLLTNTVYNSEGAGKRGFYTLNSKGKFELKKPVELEHINSYYSSGLGMKKWDNNYYIEFANRDSSNTFFIEFDKELNFIRSFQPMEDFIGIADYCFSDSLALLSCIDGLRFYNKNWEEVKFHEIPRNTIAKDPGDTAINYNWYNGVAYGNGYFVGMNMAEMLYFISERPTILEKDRQLYLETFDHKGNLIKKRFLGSKSIEERETRGGYYDPLLSLSQLGEFIYSGGYSYPDSSYQYPMLMGIQQFGDTIFPNYRYGKEIYNHQTTRLVIEKEKQEIVLLGDYYCYEDKCNDGMYIFTLPLKSYQSILKHHQPDFEFTIHPNPAQDHVKISGLKKERNYQYVIYNASGKAIKQGPLLNTEMDVSQLSSGTYLLNLQAANGLSATKQLMVK